MNNNCEINRNDSGLFSLSYNGDSILDSMDTIKCYHEEDGIKIFDAYKLTEIAKNGVCYGTFIIVITNKCDYKILQWDNKILDHCYTTDIMHDLVLFTVGPTSGAYNFKEQCMCLPPLYNNIVGAFRSKKNDGYTFIVENNIPNSSNVTISLVSTTDGVLFTDESIYEFEPVLTHSAFILVGYTGDYGILSMDGTLIADVVYKYIIPLPNGKFCMCNKEDEIVLLDSPNVPIPIVYDKDLVNSVQANLDN